MLTNGEASVASNGMPFQGIYKDDFGAFNLSCSLQTVLVLRTFGGHSGPLIGHNTRLGLQGLGPKPTH